MSPSSRSGLLRIGPTIEKIADVVLAADTASISFGSLPAAYRHLRVVLVGRTDRAATNDGVKVQLNGDTAANYDYQDRLNYGATISSSGTAAATQWVAGSITGDSAPASNPGMLDLTLYDYGRTQWWTVVKWLSAFRSGATTNDFQQNDGIGYWRSTAAVTSISLAPSVGSNFKAGTMATLYGVL